MVSALIGPRIRERRRALGLSQADLAKAAGISASYMNLIEHNKRGIAGRTLHVIANRLGIDAATLSDVGEGALMDQLRAAASQTPDAAAELDRLAEMVGRFPGWARTLARQVERVERRDRTIAALTDRLAHDPFLSETMHLLLSSVTAIQSTVSILSEIEELTEDERRRFIGNVANESARLTRSAQDLAAYFDNPVQATPGGDDAETRLNAFWAARSHHVPELERGGAVDDLLPEVGATDPAAEGEARAALTRYAEVARRLPLAEVVAAAEAASYDPLALAARFGAPLGDVFYRLAHLPARDGAPVFGLIECDAAGGVLYRKEAGGFSLPRQSGACPLWPLYGALTRPGQPLRAILASPDGARRVAWAQARAQPAESYETPPRAVSAMLFTDDPGLAAAARAPEIEIGPQCSICPRRDCEARRALFLLA